jgi:hypothetical protein
MDKNFTSNDLVRLLYSEVTPNEAADIRQAMKADINLKEDYNEMREAFAVIPKATFSPSRNAIQNILRYSEQSPVTA